MIAVVVVVVVILVVVVCRKLYNGSRSRTRTRTRTSSRSRSRTRTRHSSRSRSRGRRSRSSSSALLQQKYLAAALLLLFLLPKFWQYNRSRRTTRAVTYSRLAFMLARMGMIMTMVGRLCRLQTLLRIFRLFKDVAAPSLRVFQGLSRSGCKPKPSSPRNHCTFTEDPRAPKN